MVVDYAAFAFVVSMAVDYAFVYFHVRPLQSGNPMTMLVTPMHRDRS
jgi:hypothetical protein